MKVEANVNATITVEEKKGLISSQPVGSTFYIPGDPRLWIRVEAGGGEYETPSGKVSVVSLDDANFDFRDDSEVVFRDFKVVPV